MEMILSWLQQGLSVIGPFFLLLGLLIFVHELGHFLVAKYFGVRVETFSLGFGKKILQHKRGDTNYCISLIPLGGYVKMYGDDPTAEVPEAEQRYAFLHKPVGQRIGIVLAGPLMNLFFAAFLFFAIGMIGHPVASPTVGDVATDSIAHKAGFRSGDTIVQINEESVEFWKQANDLIAESPQTTLQFKVKRELSGTVETFSAAPMWVDNTELFSTDKQVGGIEGLELTSKAPLVGVASQSSAAAKAGFHSLDFITKVNDVEVRYWRQLEAELKKQSPDSQVKFEIQKFSAKGELGEKRTVVAENWTPPAGDESAITAFGFESTELYLMAVKEDSPADKAGLKKGDRILEIDGKAVSKWEEILNSVKGYTIERGSIHFVVGRDGKQVKLDIKPEMTELMNKRLQDEQRFTVGIMPAFTAVTAPPVTQQFSNPLKALSYGVSQSYYWTKMVVLSLVKLVQNEVSPRNIAGVITIGRVATESFAVGISAFLKIMAIISINLFLLNLLPIPILDGGHLLFFTLEAIRGAPLSMKKMEIAQQVGLIIMMSLMVFALFNDIRNIFGSGW